VLDSTKGASNHSPIAAIGQSFDVYEWSGSGPDYLHIHYADDEAWHILEGTLYPLLTRLKNADMLTYRWVESNSGPPRKYFSLTEKGLQFYQELEATWNELANAVNTLAAKKDSLANVPTSNNDNL